jgi:NAD(P)-dependent dehydrogenase (short-subunit alcohol dehydrogenase family)
MDLFSLEGRVAIVTGSASGLGRAMAGGLADAGAFVVCADLQGDLNREVVEEIGSERSVAFDVDVTDEDSVRALADFAGERGSVDVLVTSAGIGGRGEAVGYDDGLWEKVMSVNLTGTFRVCRAVGAKMIAGQAGGSIITIASIGGMVAFPGSVGYQASKGGVVQLTRSLAVEWAPHGVRVNAISPGHIATAIVRRQWETEPELKDFFLSRTPLGRLGTPEDLVGAAVFLASEASSMMTGQVLAVDGGYVAQ